MSRLAGSRKGWNSGHVACEIMTDRDRVTGCHWTVAWARVGSDGWLRARAGGGGPPCGNSIIQRKRLGGGGRRGNSFFYYRFPKTPDPT